MVDLVIRNCDVLELKQGSVNILQNQVIAITGKLISAIVPAEQASVQYQLPESQTIQGKGLLAIPGLINTHAHVPMVLFRGLAEDVTDEVWFNEYIWPLEANLTQEDVYWGALLGIAEMIENGITTVADHYFYMDEVAKAISGSGMRANLVWAVFGHEGEAKLDQTCAFIERWQGQANGRITAWLGPHAPYTCPNDFLKLAASKAKQLGTGIHIHVSETERQVQLSLEEHHRTPVQVLADCDILDVPTILAHCAFPTDEDIQLLKSCKTGIAHAPKTYLKLASPIVSLPRYLEAGIPVGLATDGAVSSNTLDILEQMRLTALIQKTMLKDSTRMTIPEVLDIAFHGGARVVQMENLLGDIAPGKLADIALVRQDGLGSFPRYSPAANLVYSTSSHEVDTVICDGKVLMKDRRLLTIDKEQVKREISSRLERLSQRVPEKRIATYPV